MVEHCLGMTGIVVRFYVRAPVTSGYSIMDNTIGFYPMNVGSIPASRTIKYSCGP